jgi:hypothetical protein
VPVSVLDQLKALDEQRLKLVHDAKEAAIKMANDAIQALHSLGFHYTIAEEKPKSQKAKASAGKGDAKRAQKDAECPICHFKTSPLHDGRSHRSQDPKKPFTSAELSKKGLAKVS